MPHSNDEAAAFERMVGSHARLANQSLKSKISRLPERNFRTASAKSDIIDRCAAVKVSIKQLQDLWNHLQFASLAYDEDYRVEMLRCAKALPRPNIPEGSKSLYLRWYNHDDSVLFDTHCYMLPDFRLVGKSRLFDPKILVVFQTHAFDAN